MSKQGRRLEEDHSVESVIELMSIHGGIIKNVAKAMGCSRPALYNMIDIYPEIREAQKIADDRLDRHVVESHYDILDKLAGKYEEEPAVALNAIKLSLTKSKHSRYRTEQKDAKDDQSIALAHFATMSKENAELKLKLERLESRNK